MSYFKYKADIIPISIFVALFCLDIYMYILGISGIILGIYFIFSIMTKWCIFPWNHHHQHVFTFSKPLFNRLLEVMYGLQTGITGYGWVLHHNLGHHLHYQDQSKDESAWKSPKGEKYHPLIYTFITTITSPYRAFKVGKKHPKILRYFIYMFLIHVSLISTLIYIKPLQGIIIFLIPAIIEFFLTIYITYYHHSGLESDDPYKSSYNIIDPWYNLITGNLGYHTAHHLKGSLHWSKLPKFHKTIENKITPEFYKKYSFFWKSHQ